MSNWEDELDEEVVHHLERLASHHRARGLSAAEARAAARRDFGGQLRVRERCREQRGFAWRDTPLRDVAHATRSLLRAPAFTLVAALTLALATGATLASFAVVNRVVLRPLPYPESDRLVRLEHAIPRINVASGVGMTAGLYSQYAGRARTLDGVAIYSVGDATLADGGEPVRLRTARATPSLAPVLRTAPALGRWFTDDEGRAGGRGVAVLAHGLWTARYGGDPTVLGRSIALDGVPVEIVGVMPASFAFPDPRVQAWVPESIDEAAGFGLPFSRIGIARMRAGATLEAVRAELDALIDTLPARYPGDPGVLGNVGEGGLRSVAVTLKDATVGNVVGELWFLLASVGVLLLVACANVANLFLVRMEARHREVAIRRALGASGAGLASFFIVESALLAAAGGVGGLAFAWGALRALAWLAPAGLPRLHEIHLDTMAVLLDLVLCLMAALVFGSLPLWRRTPLAASLRESTRNTAGAGRHRIRQLLMGAQVALALVLLVGSGLMVRSFQQLRAFDPGFDAASTLSFRIGLPGRAYPTRTAAVTAHNAILDRLSAIAGVTASASTALPLADSCFSNTVVVRGVPVTTNGSRPVAAFCAVAGGYVETMHLRVRRGRSLSREDILRSAPDIVVNQAFGDIVLPNQDPIGARIRSNAPPASAVRPDGEGGFTWDGAPPWLTVVGVVANTPVVALGEANPPPVIYMPMSLAGGPDIPALAMLGPDVSALSYVVRSATPAAALMPAIRRAVSAVDPTLAIADVRPLQARLDDGAAQLAFMMVVLGTAAGVALLLGLVGIYGVIAYVVTQRTAEIGVRLTLGARPAGVARMIVRQGGAVIAAGTMAGVAAAFAGARLIESLLYGISAHDPLVFLGMPLLLWVAALLACWLPARRAARLDPLVALRAE